MPQTGYIPPFSVSAEILRLVGDISELVGRLDVSVNQSRLPQLRKENRIKTIQSSLAIENNSMSLEQVTAIVEGKRVLGPPNEITEVKNAIDAYNLMLELNPYKAKDLLRAHGLMMAGLVDECGRFRNGGVGVTDGVHVVHIAPPAMRVPQLIAELIDWVKHTDTHPLVSSCVFHYEFEFIHPFADGNGRMGRMWQTLLLMQWRPLFAWLPVETIVKENQQEYYRVISLCDSKGESTAFIEFMLRCLYDALAEMEKSSQKSNQKSNQKILNLIIANPAISMREMQEETGLSESGVKKVIRQLREAGLLVREGGAKGGHWKVTK